MAPFLWSYSRQDHHWAIRLLEETLTIWPRGIDPDVSVSTQPGEANDHVLWLHINTATLHYETCTEEELWSYKNVAVEGWPQSSLTVELCWPHLRWQTTIDAIHSPCMYEQTVNWLLLVCVWEHLVTMLDVAKCFQHRPMIVAWWSHSASAVYSATVCLAWGSIIQSTGIS